MSVKKIFHDIDLRKQQLLQARFQNVTNAQQTTLAGELTSSHKGLIIYNTDLSKVYIWSGSAFTEITQSISVGTYRGSVAHDDPAPSSPNTGDWVVFSSAGTATNFGDAVVEPQDLAFYNGTSWDVVQANLQVATDTVAGKVRQATFAEVLGSENVVAFLNPQQVKDKISSRSYRAFVDLLANTPFSITHELKDNRVDVKFYLDGEDFPSEIYYQAVGVDNIIVTSPEALTNVFVVISSHIG